MRELDSNELSSVSGGLVGTPIPFVNGFIPGPNWPGGFPAAVNMAILSFEVGYAAGSKLNGWVNSTFGMSTGEALYHTLND